MKLRVAKKIYNAIGTPRESAYTPVQTERALNRVERTKSSKEINKYFDLMMRYLGPGGWAEVLAAGGNTGQAFDLLMRSEKWSGDPDVKLVCKGDK